ncbi:hypothetical protein CYMTET_36756, partial [Cymbomonas tetramitiformis]
MRGLSIGENGCTADDVTDGFTGFMCAANMMWASSSQPPPACEQLLAQARTIDHRFNFEVCANNRGYLDVCADLHIIGNCTSDAIVAILGSDPVKGYEDRGVEWGACTLHADCPYGYFCALVGAAGGRSSTCMQCTMCKGCFTEEYDSSLWPWAGYEYWPAEPTCGHCLCENDPVTDTCARAELHNGQCDASCWLANTSWDNYACIQEELVSEEVDCTQFTDAAQVLDNVWNSEYEEYFDYMMCCDANLADRQMSFSVFSHSSKENAETLYKDSTMSNGTALGTALRRFVNDNNRIIA